MSSRCTLANNCIQSFALTYKIWICNNTQKHLHVVKTNPISILLYMALKRDHKYKLPVKEKHQSCQAGLLAIL